MFKSNSKSKFSGFKRDKFNLNMNIYTNERYIYNFI